MIRALQRVSFHRAMLSVAGPSAHRAVIAPQRSLMATNSSKAGGKGENDNVPMRQRRRGDWGTAALTPFSDNIFDPFNVLSSLMLPGQGLQPMGPVPMAMDLTESDKKFTVKVDIPGVNKEDISLETSGDLLTISVEHTEEKEDKGEGEERAHRIERTRMSASRSVTMPPRAQLDSVSASYKDGVLTLDIAKVPEDKPGKKKIAIN